MGSKKGRTHFGEVIINDVLRMVEEGKTQREISEFYGFESKTVVKALLCRHRKKNRSLQAGILPRKKGRPHKNNVQTEDRKDSEIARLKMENDLLRSFLYEAERWNAKA